MKKNLIAFLFAAILCTFIIVPVLASEPVGGGTATTGGNSHIIWDENESGDSWVRQNADEVTVDDAISWVDRKGSQVVELCAHFLKPVCVVGFILCVILMVVHLRPLLYLCHEPCPNHERVRFFREGVS